jgi:hypothetical protein
MARFRKSYGIGRSSAATVDGLSGSEIASDIAERNATIQYRDDGVDIGAKGGIEYVDFTGAGVTATNPAAGILQVDISGTPTAHAASHKLGGSDVILLNEFGNPTASVEFNQQQALQFRIENRTSDPGSPAVGQMWLRTDL